MFELFFLAVSHTPLLGYCTGRASFNDAFNTGWRLVCSTCLGTLDFKFEIDVVPWSKEATGQPSRICSDGRQSQKEDSISRLLAAECC